MSLLRKAKKLKSGYNLIAGPSNTELELLELGQVMLKKDECYECTTGDREQVWSIFCGSADVKVKHSSGALNFPNCGSRQDIFSGKATGIYFSPGVSYSVRCKSLEFLAGVFTSPGKGKKKPVLIRPEQTISKTFGKSNWIRDAVIIAGSNVDAGSLIVGETFNPPGCWSSYPPHKHDTLKAPNEAPYEEIYLFFVRPLQGFGTIRVYTGKYAQKPIDEIYVVKNQDSVVIPRGYHPVSAAPGYRLAYFWGLAGEGRQFGAWSDDPDHSWIRDCEPML